jgi:hypothetical protein
MTAPDCRKSPEAARPKAVPKSAARVSKILADMAVSCRLPLIDSKASISSVFRFQEYGSSGVMTEAND